MANQTYQLVITGNAGGQFVQNVLHYFMDDAAYADPVSAAKGLVDGWLAADMLDEWCDMCCGAYTVKSVKCRRATGGVGPEWLDVSVDGTPGNRGSTMQASSNGPVILWIPASPNRVTCKTFIPGASTGDVEIGELSAAALTAIQAAATNMLETFPAVGGGTPNVTLCCVAANNKANRRLIALARVCKEIGVQRRRQLPV